MEVVQHLQTILQLKRTLSPRTLSPMGWREIGKRLGLSPMGARYHARDVLHDPKRCPCCLQTLSESEK